MVAYRISDCRYINDLSGRGAALYGARWNSKDVFVVYTAQTPALALLETIVHMGSIPELGYCMITLDIPADTLDAIEAADLPANWQQSPPPDYLRSIGDTFFYANKKIGIKVPSVVMPEEYNIILNPRHKDFGLVKIISQRPLTIDERLKRHL